MLKEMLAGWKTASYYLFYDDGRLVGGWKGRGDPVDDVEEEESQWKGLARKLVDVTCPSLARLDIHCACEVSSAEALLLDRLPASNENGMSWIRC